MTTCKYLKRWKSELEVFRDRRHLVILLMGFSSGLPLLLGFSTLSWWLKGEGISKTEIGLFVAVAWPYAFKAIWAPIVDHVRLPFLCRRMGQRRGWLLPIQVCLMFSIIALGWSDPKESLTYMAVMAIVVAFFSATQDIVIDAYRIEILDQSETEQGAGSGSTQLGYRVGLLIAGAGAVALSDYFDWFWIYAIMAAFVLIGIFAVFIADDPKNHFPTKLSSEQKSSSLARFVGTLEETIVRPFLEFWRRTKAGAVWAIIFILLYKYGDAFAGAMAYPFYLELGFTGVEVAAVTKVFGICMAAAGIVVGGFLILRKGVIWGLVVGGILQAVTNLLFAYLAVQGKDLTWLTIAIGADNFTGGLGSAAFVAFLSRLCNVTFTATQFALFTSLMAISRILLAAPSGWLADQIGWVAFFAATTLLAVPALLLIVVINRYYDRLLPARGSVD